MLQEHRLSYYAALSLLIVSAVVPSFLSVPQHDLTAHDEKLRFKRFARLGDPCDDFTPGFGCSGRNVECRESPYELGVKYCVCRPGYVTHPGGNACIPQSATRLAQQRPVAVILTHPNSPEFQGNMQRVYPVNAPAPRMLTTSRPTTNCPHCVRVLPERPLVRALPLTTPMHLPPGRQQQQQLSTTPPMPAVTNNVPLLRPQIVPRPATLEHRNLVLVTSKPLTPRGLLPTPEVQRVNVETETTTPSFIDTIPLIQLPEPGTSNTIAQTTVEVPAGTTVTTTTDRQVLAEILRFDNNSMLIEEPSEPEPEPLQLTSGNATVAQIKLTNILGFILASLSPFALLHPDSANFTTNITLADGNDYSNSIGDEPPPEIRLELHKSL